MKGERLFAILVYLYPPAFRRRYGAELMWFFRKHRADSRFAGRRGAMRFWRHTIGDLARTATAEWVTAVRSLDRPRWESFVHDTRYAIRSLRRTPGFTMTVVLTLTIGIGAAASMYGVMSRLLLLPPPHVNEADRVVRPWFVYERPSLPPRTSESREYGLLDHVRENARTLAAFAGYASREVVVGSGADATLGQATFASAGFWRTLSVEPISGRFFSDEEARPGSGARVVVLGHAFWRRRYGGSEAVVGQTLSARQNSYEIIGIAPRGFRGVELAESDLWFPISSYGDGERGAATWHHRGAVSFVGRLTPDATAERASSELTALYATYINPFRPPTTRDPDARTVVRAVPIIGSSNAQLEFASGTRIVAWLVGISGILLCAACATVASLLLLRAMRRRREFAVRVALGISHRRLLAQLFTETSLLALAGGAGALVVVAWGGAWINRLLVPQLNWEPGTFDWTVLIVASVSTFVTLLITGFAPAFELRHAAFVNQVSHRGSARRSRLQTALLVAQTTLSVVLLIGAGLFVRSLQRVAALDLGFDTKNVLAATVSFSGSGLSASEVGAFYERALDLARRLPGVEGASLAYSVPLRLALAGGLQFPEGVTAIPGAGQGLPSVNFVTPEFFSTTGMRVVQGRPFLPNERNAPVVVINETIARMGWPDRSPIGECVPRRTSQGCATIVGVVKDPRAFSLRETGWLYYYEPLVREDPRAGALLVRVAPGATRVGDALRRSLAEREPGLPFVRIETLAEALEPQIRPFRVGATVFTAFGTIAMVLAALGLYSALAYGVAQRKREWGVRMAIGAATRDIVGLVLSEGLRVALVGLGGGLIVAIVASRWVGDLLFDVSPRDPVVLSAVAIVIVAVAVLASLVPARRAANVAPMDALRAD